MNGLTLRITGGSSKKTKTSIGFAPVVVNFNKDLGENNMTKEFRQASNSDAQLAILKTVFNEIDNAPDEHMMEFITTVFFQAESKHPVKCFITRQITKRVDLQDIFANILTEDIKTYISNEHSDFKTYIDIVTKLSACVENFPAGAMAFKNIEISLVIYFNKCLECCITTLRQNSSLSPTDKNDIFNLAHLASRLLLHIIQKVDYASVSNLTTLFSTIRIFLRQLLLDKDVPMDTKSVCGILYLSMHLLEYGSDSWVDILQPHSDTKLGDLLRDGGSQLSLYSAITTVVSVDKLQSQIIENSPACLVLTYLLLEIGERSSSESVFLLGVSRTLLQLCKMLDKVTNQDMGLKMVDSLLVFVWSHLEHYMDSVRHLTAQMMTCVVKYCGHLKKKGDDKALSKLFSALLSLDKTRKSYYLSISSLTTELGALSVMERLPNVIPELLNALNIQAVQASATTALETMLQRHINECSTEEIHKQWIQPIMTHVNTNTLDSTVLNILENLMVKSVKCNQSIMDCILPYVNQTDISSSNNDLKCVLMLLSVVRKSGVTTNLCTDYCNKWKGLISYDVLKTAAVDAVDETRILSLSLIVESPKSTEAFTQGDLSFILYYLKYNINAQAPNFRQLTLSIMKKFMKRLEDSGKVLKKHQHPQYFEYTDFIDELRALCFDSLLPAANYSRRCVALQMLVWSEQIQSDRVWKREYVEKLLLHLEDSYENNKAFALEILDKCPVELFKENTYTISTNFEDILEQASSLKPTDCTSAAYKFDFLRNKLPHNILQGTVCKTTEPVMFTLLQRLLTKLTVELDICTRNIVVGARDAPMYGVLHCVGHLIKYVDPDAIREDTSWSKLISLVISCCVKVNASVACVVNSSSPEGHLPMDACGVAVGDHGNSGGVALADGRPVTAQMVLLCAWRSVKEVSLLLGTISSRLSISNEGNSSGTLQVNQLSAMGEHFTTLLAETKHRGAFEQAYVGFTRLLDRLWRCRNAELHSLPRLWLSQLMSTIMSREKGTLCATRRSAGVPFMIQALVTSEVQALGSPRCFHDCVTQLIQRCSNTRSTTLEISTTEQIEDSQENIDKTNSGEIESRTDEFTVTDKHTETKAGDVGDGLVNVDELEAEVWSRCSNVLRALVRTSALHSAVTLHVQDALLAALQGFHGRTWTERNSSTLLFSALMVRTFGVTRTRDHDALCVRNKMTGRIFFLRYPRLYDYMLEKLQEVSRSEDEQTIHPSLYPILLLLARLYPSSLEGTVSNLKLVAYIPHVLSCAKSSVLKTRQLAAKAMVPLISPEQYLQHLESMFTILHDKNIKRNYCHGILLQLIRLLDAKPEVTIDNEMVDRLACSVDGSVWVLEQAVGDVPCYVIADECVKVLNLLVWRFPKILKDETINTIVTLLPLLIFKEKIPNVTSGRDVCLANSLYLYFIIVTKLNKIDKLCEMALKGLEHKIYDVVLATLNSILILHKDLEPENKFQEHLVTIRNDTVLLIKLKNCENYIKSLCEIMKYAKYLECKQKSLKILSIEGDTQQASIENCEISIDCIVRKLFDFINDSHENLTHIYLENLSNFVTKNLEQLNLDSLVNVLRTIFACSTSENKDENRAVAVGFMEKNAAQLMKLDLNGLSDEEQFEYTATLLATLITTLEDDSDTLRQRTANTILSILGINSRIPSKCAEMLRDYIEVYKDNVALYVLVALLDFRSEVCVTDEINDECRVFDQNERYNIFLEETVWTSECAKKICKINNTDSRVIDTVLSTIANPIYASSYDKLCSNNIVLFKKMVLHGSECKNDIVNPKIRLFVEMLS